MREALKRTYIGLTGSRWSEAVGRRLFDRRLRVLAYHDVTDPRAFEAQMRHIRRSYAPVSLEDLLAVDDGAPLPTGAVWVTFDDGHPGVIDHAMPILGRLGIKATLFACPGLVDSTRPFWWDVVRTALKHGVRPSFDGRYWGDGAAVTALKALPDPDRRAVVDELATELDALGVEMERRQLTLAELVGWVEAGHDVGNHTWDHPCLGRCEPAEQERQILEADRWLRRNLPRYLPAFAYPDGDWSSRTESALAGLGYRIALGFDHRLARPERSLLRLSRLRVSADADLQRFRSIVSGLHSLPFTLGDLSTGSRGRRLGAAT